MTEITIQDVAQYLAEHGYARWAELTARKMMTEEAMWTRLQTNYDPSRAIDPRYITFPTVDLSKYAKDADIKQWVQEQGYATTVPSLSGYATQQWVQEQGFLTQHQSLSGYATQQWVTARIQSSVSGFASQAWVGQSFLPLSGGTMTGDIESQNIIPVTDNTYSLGTSTKRWSIIRSMKADFAAEIYTHGKIYAYGNIQPMPNSNNAYPQLGTSAARWANVLTSGVNSAGNIIPSTTETYQLGTSQYRWNNVVTKSINATGTSSLAALSVSGSATFNNDINVATGSLTIGSCTISWDSAVSMLRFSTGIYSDGAVTAGGVGTSGGSSGGGLSWENLAASTTEQIALSHMTTALSGYVSLSSAQVISGAKDFTSRIKVSDVGDLYVGGVFYDSYDWVGLWSQHDILVQSESDVLIDGEHVDINSVSGTYVGGAVSLSSTLTASGQVTAKKFVATDYDSSDSLLRGDGTATSLLGLFSSMSVSGSTLYVTVGGTEKSVTLPTGLTSYGYRPQIGNLSSSGVTWLSDSAYVVMPLKYNAGYYQIDLSGYTFPQNVKAKGGLVSTDYNSSDYLLTGNGGAKYAPNVFNGVSVNGTTLTVTIFDTSKSVNLSNCGFLIGSGNNTFTGINTFKNTTYIYGSNALVFGIDCGIGATSEDKLELHGNNGVLISSNTVVNGTVTATGFVNSSDLRMKNLFGDVGLSVADIAAMPAVRFRWNSGRDTQAMHVGTIAQAWQTLLPEVVLEGSDDLLSMDYASAALVSVINVAKSVSDHERRILDLEAENRRLKTELEQLKSA